MIGYSTLRLLNSRFVNNHSRFRVFSILRLPEEGTSGNIETFRQKRISYNFFFCDGRTVRDTPTQDRAERQFSVFHFFTRMRAISMTPVIVVFAAVTSVAEAERVLSAENPNNCVHYAKTTNNNPRLTPRADARDKVRVTNLCSLFTHGVHRRLHRLASLFDAPASPCSSSRVLT